MTIWPGTPTRRMHLALTLATLGLWGFVWLALELASARKARVIALPPEGEEDADAQPGWYPYGSTGQARYWDGSHWK